MAFTKFPGFSVDWTTKATKISGQASNFKTWLNTRTAELQDYIDNVLLGEIDTALGGKSDTTHNHDTSYAPASHNHDTSYAPASHLADDATQSKLGHVILGKPGTAVVVPCTTQNITIYVGYNVSATGTAGINGTTTVTGSSTLFATELAVNDYICINNEMRKITTITSNTALTVASAFTATASGQTVTICKKGNDANDGSAADAAHALSTIQSAIDRLPKLIYHSVTIRVAKGYYPETVVIAGFHGHGDLKLYGKGSSYHDYTEQWQMENIGIAINTVKIDVYGFRFNVVGLSPITIDNNPGWIALKGNSMIAADSSYAGVRVNGSSTVHVWGSMIANKGYGIFTSHGAHVQSNTNYGFNNTYGLCAQHGGVIAKYDTNQPQGTTANESVAYGGVIR